ncbi:DUF11 domain-containing protein [Amycolatopsis sp. AA4]|uniref:DUF7927 domain-containing protein n=1 Tax=Actinomycetes TaxID=1760 RepID=UPI0001B555D6|nr:MULTISPECIES: DUF11 domain-containing protein [Actinomycetes]ATY12621.1 DUF11 domain-containing protein [Amycolatopsis sp. AA4]EFL08420.1 predicted protein [Streptomyces sp. AA4]
MVRWAGGSGKAIRRSAAQFLVLAVAVSGLAVGGAVPASAQTWPVEGERSPSVFDCDHLYYSNFRSGMQFRTNAAGDAEIENTVVSKRAGSGPPDYWSTDMALGKDPDTGRPAAFYSSYTSANRTLYKHVSGTDEVTDRIAAGETRELPAGTNWGGTAADPNTGMLFGAQNGGAPKLFGMNLATGATTVWTRGSNLAPVPSDDPVFLGGSLVPDLFVDADGGAYYGISYGGSTYVYRLDPATGTTTRAVRVVGPGSGNGFNNYGMAYFHGSIYLGYYGGALYKVDPRTGASTPVPGGNAQDNQVGRIKSESGGSWPITDLASCSIAPNLTSRLVVRKTASEQTAKPGDTVRYTVTIANEGDAPAPAARLTDDLSAVLDDAAYNNDAVTTTGGAPTPTQPGYAGQKLTWTGAIAPGDTVTLAYSVTVGKPPGGDKKLTNVVTVPESNCAEASKDPACATVVPIATLKIAKHASPANPSPGSVVSYTVTVTNDGTADWAGASVADDLTDVLDDAAYNNDARATGSGTVAYEPGRALRWTGDVKAGTTVTITYSVTVADPPRGNRRLINRVVGPDGSNCGTDPSCTTDEPISGVVIRKSASPATAKPGDTVTYTITAENIGGATASAVKLTDDLTGVVDEAAYNDNAVAMIGGTAAATQPGYDPNTAKLTWTGDIPAAQTVTISYTVTVASPPRGDRNLRNTVTGPADSNCAPNSTDCSTETPIGALEIKKTADRTDAKPGERVGYTVTVRNIGEAAYPGATFTDDLSGVLDDATWNNDATATSGTTSFAAPRLNWTGDVPAGATVTVRYSVTVGAPPAGDKHLRNLVTGPDGSTCPPGSADPDCGTDTGVGTLELSKTAAPATAQPGDKVTYTVTARNTGTATYRGAGFTDDLSRVLDDATYNNDATATSGSVAYAAPNLTWTADLPAGATVTITYSVTVRATQTGDNELRNAVTGPPDSTCPPGNTAPDCNPVTPVARLHVKKTASPSDPRPGDTVAYTVLVANDGKATYRGAAVTDDLTGVLDDATYDNDARATSGTTAYTAPKLTWSGDVEAGATVTITYTVTVHNPPRGDKKLANAVTGADNCPPGGSDPDCGTVTPLPALKITKTATPAEIKTGDRVSYTVTVENVGEADYRRASFTDNLTGVLDDATYNGDAKADTGTVVLAPPTLTWTGDLAKGATATITYSVTVTNAGDHRLVNTVTGNGSNCPEGSADPGCRVILPKPHLRIAKTADPAIAQPGGKVTYTVTVRNLGEASQPDASFTDDLSGVLDDAAYNGDATATGGTVHFVQPRLQWTGSLAPGAEVTIRYSVTVGDPPRGDRILRNAVTSPDDTNCLTRDPVCGTETPVREMTIAKRAGVPTAKPGEKVTYTVDLVNTGSAAYPDATFVDDLADVLDDATYNQDAQATSGSVEQTGSKLTWHGTLAVGQTVTVVYSVTVKPEATAGNRLRNVVVSPNPGTNCVTGAEPGCGTTTPVTPPTGPPGTPPTTPPGVPPTGPGPLASTGTPLWNLLLGSVFSLLTGFALLVAARRRSRRS